MTKNFTLRADYTYTVAKADSMTTCTSPPCAGQQLVRRPKNKASLTATWQATDRLSLSSTLLYVGPWWDLNRWDTETDIKAPGFTTVNLAANYALRSDTTLFARIDNLFNKQYEDPLGFLRPGFGAFAGIKFSAGGNPSSGTASSAVQSTNPTAPAPTPRSQGVM